MCIPKHAPPGDQSVVSKIYRQRAVDYVNDGHRTQFAKVVLARIGRDWGLFRPLDMQFINESEGRPRWVTDARHVVVLPARSRSRSAAWSCCSGGGCASGRCGPADHRHRRDGALVRADAASGCPAEPVIVVLAACAIAAIAGAHRSTSDASSSS